MIEFVERLNCMKRGDAMRSGRPLIQILSANVSIVAGSSLLWSGGPTLDEKATFNDGLCSNRETGKHP